MTGRRMLVVDCETTGLNPELHEIWELGIIEMLPAGSPGGVPFTEHLWRMKPELAAADPGALAVGRFYERTVNMPAGSGAGVYDLVKHRPAWSAPGDLALAVARLVDGATIIGANPAFDAGFLDQFLRDNGQAPTWHYRLRDIGSMAYGYLSACLALGVEGRDAALGVPGIDASTDDFARALSVDPGEFERHSALGDCHLALAMLNVITGGA